VVASGHERSGVQKLYGITETIVIDEKLTPTPSRRLGGGSPEFAERM